MIDVLTLTREGRLAVIELKADEDIHLPLQGIDYWSRVVWHQERNEFHKFWVFFRTRDRERVAVTHTGRPGTACASCDRHIVALHFAAN